MYLKGFCSPVSFFIDPSMMSDVHCGTDWCAYTAFCARSTGLSRCLRFRDAAARAGGAAGAGGGGAVAHGERRLDRRLHLLLDLLLHERRLRTRHARG